MRHHAARTVFTGCDDGLLSRIEGIPSLNGVSCAYHQIAIPIVPSEAAQKSTKVVSWDQSKIGISQNREAERIRRRAARDRRF